MSAEVAIEKFTFSCAARLSPQHEVTQKGCVQVKSPVAVKGALVHKVTQTQGKAKPPNGKEVAPARVVVCAEASQSTVLSRQSTFEKLVVECEDQRPAAKRQLSSESAARTITVVKKSTVRKEAEEERHPKPKVPLGQKVTSCTAATGKRRRRRDLFTNSEVFHRMDSHVIRAGAEVRAPTVHAKIRLTCSLQWPTPGEVGATQTAAVLESRAKTKTQELCRKRSEEPRHLLVYCRKSSQAAAHILESNLVLSEHQTTWDD